MATSSWQFATYTEISTSNGVLKWWGDSLTSACRGHLQGDTPMINRRFLNLLAYRSNANIYDIFHNN